MEAIRIECKVVVVGGAKVGKSELCRQIAGEPLLLKHDATKEIKTYVKFGAGSKQDIILKLTDTPSSLR